MQRKMKGTHMKRNVFGAVRMLALVAALVAAGWVGAAMPPMPERTQAEMANTREEALKQAATATRAIAPNANTLTLAETEWAEYQADGTDISWIDFWVKALTDQGAQELRVMPLWFKEGYSEAEFIQAEVVRADGTVDPIDLAANVAIATSNDSTDANIYDPKAKRVVLTVPKVAVGDTLHVIAAFRTVRPRIPDTYYTRSVFESFDGPVPYSTLTVVAPKELPLRSKALLDEVPGTVTSSSETLADGRTLHRWVARNVPQSFPEEKMPSPEILLQRVGLSTFATWEEVSKWYWDLCNRHMATTPAIDAKVRELTQGKNRDAQIEALFAFVAQEVRYMGIIAEEEAPGFEPHDVSLTFDNRYGVCRDKGVLLVAMLRKAGFDAYPVIIHAGSPRDKEVPMPFFNHAIVAIDEGNRSYRLLDPTDDTARAELPAYLSACSYLVARPDGETLLETPVPSPEKNMVEIETVGELDAAGTLQLTSTLHIGGVNDNVYRPLFVRSQPDRVRDVFDGLMKRVAAGAELTSIEVSPKDASDISQPLTVTVRARVPKFGVPDAQGHTLVRLPFVSRVAGMVNFLFDGLEQPTRTYDWVIESPCGVRETLTLRGIGTLGQPELLPDDPILKSNGASYDIVCRRAENGDLTLTRELVLSRKIYSPEDYRALRRFAERMDRIEALRPLFIKPAVQDVDAEVLLADNSVTLAPDGTVTQRQASDTRILTFQGKRDLGEAAFTYNPDIETLTLNDIVVTTASGDRVPLNDKEISELDVDGAALSPRYPAFRQTILSLPAVDVGATIHLDTSTVTAAGASAPFCGITVFGAGAYPTHEERYTITVPAPLDGSLRIAERNFKGVNVTRTVTAEGGMVTRTWVVRDLPAIRPEPDTPAAVFTRPTLYFALDAAAPGTALAPLFAKAEALLDDLPESVEALAETLSEDLDSDDLDGRLRAVQTYLARNVRAVGPAWSSFRWGTMTPPAVTLAEGYGNRLDRILLRLALLREMDVEASLVFACGEDDESIARFGENLAFTEIPRWLNWVTPYILLPDGRVVGDEGEFDEPGAAAISSRPLLTAQGTVPYVQNEALRSRVESSIRVIVQPNGDASFSRDDYSWGLAAGQVRKTDRDLTPELRRRAIAAIAEGFASGATPSSQYLVDVDAYPTRQALSAEAKAYAQRRDRLLSIPVPALAGQVYGLRGVSRENPIWQGRVDNARNKVDLWLPPGSEIISKPEAFVYAIPGGGTYTLTCTVTPATAKDWGRVTYVAECNIRPAILDAWQFPALIELDRRLSAPTMRTLIIRLPE